MTTAPPADPLQTLRVNATAILDPATGLGELHQGEVRHRVLRHFHHESSRLSYRIVEDHLPPTGRMPAPADSERLYPAPITPPSAA